MSMNERVVFDTDSGVNVSSLTGRLHAVIDHVCQVERLKGAVFGRLANSAMWALAYAILEEERNDIAYPERGEESRRIDEERIAEAEALLAWAMDHCPARIAPDPAEVVTRLIEHAEEFGEREQQMVGAVAEVTGIERAELEQQARAERAAQAAAITASASSLTRRLQACAARDGAQFEPSVFQARKIAAAIQEKAAAQLSALTGQLFSGRSHPNAVTDLALINAVAKEIEPIAVEAEREVENRSREPVGAMH